MKRTNEVANKVGVSRRTLQYYDDEGLLGLERNSDNYRIFNQETMERIWEILVLKEMDFSLSEIKYILKLPEDEKRNYLEKQEKKLKEQMLDLKVKMKLISYVRQKGIMKLHDEKDTLTYKERIQHIIKTMKTELENN